MNKREGFQQGKHVMVIAGVLLALSAVGTAPAQEDCQQYAYVNIPGGCQLNQLSGLDTGDVDGDGNDDIVFSCILESSVTLLRATSSDQTDYERRTITSFGKVAPFPIDVAISDIDLDGKADIVVVGSPASPGVPPQTVQTVWFRNPGTSVGAWEMRVMRVNSSFKGFLFDVTQDGYPDFVPEFSNVGVALVNPGAGVLDGKPWESATIGMDGATANILWAPADLDGDPETITLLGGLRPSASTSAYTTIFRANLTGRLQFDIVGFPAVSGGIGYYPRLSIGDFDGDGIDEFLSGVDTTNASDPVSIIRVPQEGASQTLTLEPFFTIDDLSNDVFIPAMANEDGAPDLLMSRSSTSSRLSVASSPGVFPETTCAPLTDELMSRTGNAPPWVRPIGKAPQRFLIPSASQFNIAYPIQAGAGISVTFPTQISSGINPATTSQGEVTVSNTGSSSLPPSVITLSPTTSNYRLEQASIEFPEVPPGESITLPFTFSVDELAACGASIGGTVRGHFGGYLTVPISYEGFVGRDIGADKTYTDAVQTTIPDGTGGSVQRTIVTPRLSAPIDGYLVSVDLESAAGNPLAVRVENEAGEVITIFDDVVEGSGPIHLEKEVLDPVGLADGGTFLLSVTDSQPLSPAILSSWSIKVERPRTECVSPNQRRLVDQLLGIVPDSPTFDANFDGTFDAADLPIVFPD